MKLSAFIRNGTGTRRNATSGGTCFSQASSVGSKALQCGHAYEKNTSTSTLPAGAFVGCGVSTLVKSLPSTGALPCAAAGTKGTEPATPATRKAVESWRRFMFMEEATVGGG